MSNTNWTQCVIEKREDINFRQYAVEEDREVGEGNGADMMNVIFIHMTHLQIINKMLLKNNCKKTKLEG